MDRITVQEDGFQFMKFCLIRMCSDAARRKKENPPIEIKSFLLGGGAAMVQIADMIFGERINPCSYLPNWITHVSQYTDDQIWEAVLTTAIENRGVLQLLDELAMPYSLANARA